MPGGQAPQSHIDPVTRDALRSFKAILAAKYGPHLRFALPLRLRARGDHRPDSDIDIAVFLDEAPDPIGEQFDLIERGYDIVLDTGVNIQPWVFAQASRAIPPTIGLRTWSAPSGARAYPCDR